MLSEILIIGLPIALIVFCAVCVSRYTEAKSANKKNPDTYTEAEINTRKLLMIISLVLIGLGVVAIIAFAVLLFFAIAFM